MFGTLTRLGGCALELADAPDVGELEDDVVQPLRTADKRMAATLHNIVLVGVLIMLFPLNQLVASSNYGFPLYSFWEVRDAPLWAGVRVR